MAELTGYVQYRFRSDEHDTNVLLKGEAEWVRQKVEELGLSGLGWTMPIGKDDKKSEGGEEWSKQTAIYPRLSAVPSKAKTVAFNYDKDILCKIEYDEDSKLPEGMSCFNCSHNNND